MTEFSQTIETNETNAEICSDLKACKVNGIIKQNMLWSLGAGLIPIPFLDMAGIMVVEIKMLKEISDEYKVTFSENAAKSAIAALAAGLGSIWFEAFAIEAFSLIPIVGQMVHTVAVPVLAAAFTYAIGHVFDNHFRKGGTYANFNASQVKDTFNKAFSKGQQMAGDLHKSEKNK